MAGWTVTGTIIIPFLQLAGPNAHLQWSSAMVKLPQASASGASFSGYLPQGLYLSSQVNSARIELFEFLGTIDDRDLIW